jgi:hypothetical protein
VSLSDPQVIRFVNEQFVPVWQSVRPVPKVTIDFGNGKVLKRTLAGNTVIQICRADGRVVDALPGVYVPKDLIQEASRGLELVRKLDGGCANPDAEVIAWHKEALTARNVDAAAFRGTLSKALVESPLLRALRANPGKLPDAAMLASTLGRSPLQLDASDPEATFKQVSQILQDVSKQPATVQQLEAQFLVVPEKVFPGGRRPTAEELGKLGVEVDSRINVNWFRPAIHLQFAAGKQLLDPVTHRDAVFKQILHIPVDDPYLGLMDALVPGTPMGR